MDHKFDLNDTILCLIHISVTFRYCVMYEITKVSAACKRNSPSWLLDEVNPWERYERFTHSAKRPSSNFVIEKDYSDISSHLVHPWMTPHLMRPGQQICATCYPRYMRPELGNQCPGTGLLGHASRWRALHKHDCQGTFTMVSAPQRACTCGVGPNAFILT